ncbi:MAG: C39 family peptidase [Anaerolineales bacterium]
MKFRKKQVLLLAIPLLLVLAVILYQIPPIYNRFAWRMDDLKTRIKYALNPPDEAVFIPQEPIDTLTPSPVREIDPTPTPNTSKTTPANTQQTLTPTPRATPLPDFVKIDDIIYVHQHERWNYCGPANLAMALKFWGWDGTRDDIAKVVKPGINNPNLDFIQRGKTDKNVMPSEMIDFISEETAFHVVARYGGNLDLIKKFIANGYPVLVEKGYYEADYTGKVAWLGHYLFTTGYSESEREFIVQDAYLEPGKNMRVDYQVYLEGWRSFNYLFMIVYPPDRQDEVYDLLGPWADPAWSYQHALDIAEQETTTLSGINLFFAWFNKGTSLVKLQRYPEAAAAYDQAFQIYSELANDDTQRPYRIMWYQTWPYMAYYYSGRYQDTLNLANHTLNETISEPELEESLYWRALAKEALGDINGAIADLRQAVHLNKHFEIAQFHLNRLLDQ